MNNQRIVTLAGAVLLSAFCLAPRAGAQDTNSAVTHHDEMMNNSSPTGQMHNSMATSNDATGMSHETGQMKSETERDEKNGQTMMNGHMSESEHTGVTDNPSTGAMSH
jgi:hypothetical protein